MTVGIETALRREMDGVVAGLNLLVRIPGIALNGFGDTHLDRSASLAAGLLSG
jgi:hypothetical protein